MSVLDLDHPPTESHRHPLRDVVNYDDGVVADTVPSPTGDAAGAGANWHTG